jgi:DNA-binding MarR family transcriptional regulator
MTNFASPRTEEMTESQPEASPPASAKHTKRIAKVENEQPLRRRLLELLSKSPETPTVLADRLGARKESVSRLLKELRSEGVVEVRRISGDRRKRSYLLTAAGQVELSRHYTYGKPNDPAPEPSQEGTSSFLWLALEATTKLRRERNQLSEAAERQSGVLREAHKIGDGALIVEALNELATTRRQIRQEPEVNVLLHELEQISAGKSEHSNPTLALAALAHREYALGRRRESDGTDLKRRLGHLMTATNIYRQLADTGSGGAQRWREREAWSMIGFASNLRANSQLEAALESAALALGRFEEIEDAYGRSHAHFMIGFCLRLLGDFEGAWDWLAEAHRLSVDNGFERFQADSLLQIGEVLRYREDLDRAKEVLEESSMRSDRLGLVVTQGFSLSALGAIAFRREEWAPAKLEFLRAHGRFSFAHHREGLALNARRRAAVARLLYGEAAENDLDPARWLIAEAQEYYRDRGSPAGFVACQIERGRLERTRGGGISDEIVAELLDLIDPGTAEHDRAFERKYLELDPWVPQVLNAFAEETEQPKFIDRSHHLLRSAQIRLYDSVRRAAAIVGNKSGTERNSSDLEFVADEMGAETRHVEVASELSVA